MPHGPAAVLGRGPAGVVLSNQSDRNLCGWLPFGRVLAARGFQVLLYDYGIAGDLSDDIAAAVDQLHRFGARRVVLVGASEGAKASLVVGGDAHGEDLLSGGSGRASTPPCSPSSDATPTRPRAGVARLERHAQP
jgi:hypothetical protein